MVLKNSYTVYKEIEEKISLIVDDVLVIYGIMHMNSGGSRLTYKSWNYNEGTLDINFTKSEGGDAIFRLSLSHLNSADALKGCDYYELKEKWESSFIEK